MRCLKISEKQVDEVFQLRHREKWTLKKIADHFHVSIKTIQTIVQGKSHRGVAIDEAVRRACVRAERKKLSIRRRSRSKPCAGWKPSLQKQVHVRQSKLRKAAMKYRFSSLSIRTVANRFGISPTSLHRELVHRGIRRREK